MYVLYGEYVFLKKLQFIAQLDQKTETSDCVPTHNASKDARRIWSRTVKKTLGRVLFFINVPQRFWRIVLDRFTNVPQSPFLISTKPSLLQRVQDCIFGSPVLWFILTGTLSGSLGWGGVTCELLGRIVSPILIHWSNSDTKLPVYCLFYILTFWILSCIATFKIYLLKGTRRNLQIKQKVGFVLVRCSGIRLLISSLLGFEWGNILDNFGNRDFIQVCVDSIPAQSTTWTTPQGFIYSFKLPRAIKLFTSLTLTFYSLCKIISILFRANEIIHSVPSIKDKLLTQGA